MGKCWNVVEADEEERSVIVWVFDLLETFCMTVSSRCLNVSRG